MKRREVIDNINIRSGDVIIGFASSGQATYEDEYNSGIGSNGLTSARHDVFTKRVGEKYPETYDHSLEEKYIYSGNHWLTASPPNSLAKGEGEKTALDIGKLG